MAAAANAAKIQADAQAQMGQAIGAGLQKAGAAVGDYMSQKADYEASSKIFDSPSFRQAMGLSEDDAKQQKTILKELVGEGGYKAANAYAKQQIDSLLNYHAASLNFDRQMQLQNLRNEPEYARITASLASQKSMPDLTSAAAGVKAVTGSATMPAPMPGAELDLQDAVGKLESFMVQKYGPDYKARRINPTAKDMQEFGSR